MEGRSRLGPLAERQFALLYAGQAVSLLGDAGAFFRPAATGLIPATVSPARLHEANALLAMTANGARILGPALAGALVATAGAGIAIAVDAGTFVVSAAFLVQLRPVRAER